MINNTIQLNNRGFTIIEMMVSVFMLTVVISGSMLLIYRSVGTANANVIENIARNLAAEGIELVDNTRTTNFLKKSTWTSNFDSCFNSSGCYIGVDTVIQVVPDSIFKPCGSVCPKLKYDNNAGYQYTVGGETNFRRTIKIENFSNNGPIPTDAILVTSRVDTLVGGQSYTTELKKVFTNWVKN